MMIFGYEVGSTKVVVIGRSNWVQDPRGTRRVQKRVQKKIKDTKSPMFANISVTKRARKMIFEYDISRAWGKNLVRSNLGYAPRGLPRAQ